MAVEFLSISALLGKADLTFRYAGGSSIVFNFLRSYIFGKVLRTVEYPVGDLSSIKLYRPTISRLKDVIAAAQPPPYPTCYLSASDVKQLVLWTAPHFTERVTTDRDVYNLMDGAWLMWSKYSESEQAIPRRGVKLEGNALKKEKLPVAKSTEQIQDEIIDLCRRLSKDSNIENKVYDQIVDLITDQDPATLALGRNFVHDPQEFRHHILRLLHRRQTLTHASNSIHNPTHQHQSKHSI